MTPAPRWKGADNDPEAQAAYARLQSKLLIRALWHPDRAMGCLIVAAICSQHMRAIRLHARHPGSERAYELVEHGRFRVRENLIRLWNDTAEQRRIAKLSDEFFDAEIQALCEPFDA